MTLFLQCSISVLKHVARKRDAALSSDTNSLYKNELRQLVKRRSEVKRRIAASGLQECAPTA